MTTAVRGAGAVLAVALPLFPFIALAIRLQSPGPIFLRQRRAGRLKDHADGATTRPHEAEFETFEMLKFRSMYADAEKYTGPVLAEKDDPRITPVGRILRKTRLDELPQLINVLKGDMSLVGPRPERPELMSVMAAAIPYFEERMRGVKPGITGLAQVSLEYTGAVPPGSEMEPHVTSFNNPYELDGAEGALADDLRMKLLYDLAYTVATERLDTFLPMELKIVVKTPWVMLRGAGR